MPFDYMHSNIPRSYADAPEKAEAQYLAELRERAGLLYRLGYDRAEVQRRLQGNLAWDWECNPRPSFVDAIAEAIPRIVEETFSKPKPPEKGRRVTAVDLKVIPKD